MSILHMRNKPGTGQGVCVCACIAGQSQGLDARSMTQSHSARTSMGGDSKVPPQELKWCEGTLRTVTVRVTSSHLSHILLVRSKSQVPPTPGWGLHVGVDTITGPLEGLSPQFLILFVDFLSSLCLVMSAVYNLNKKYVRPPAAFLAFFPDPPGLRGPAARESIPSWPHPGEMVPGIL